MKVFTGKVISKKMDKTATVAVVRIVTHPVYKKRFKRIKKYHVHDDLGVKVGQVVRFIACKPYSKLKKWKLIGISEKTSQHKEKSGGKRKTAIKGLNVKEDKKKSVKILKRKGTVK